MRTLLCRSAKGKNPRTREQQITTGNHLRVLATSLHAISDTVLLRYVWEE